MDYTNLLNDTTGKKSKVGIIGATRGYGYTLLAQIPHVKLMELRVICSRHPDECLDVLKELGYDKGEIVVCENKEQIDNASKDAVLIVSDYHLVMECGITALVECTGNTAVSSDAALSALRRYTSCKSDFINTTSPDSRAISLPEPIAVPTSA